MNDRGAPKSWYHLRHESPAHRLPEALRNRDPRRGADCGWVEQMQLLLGQFSSAGQRVLDPFAGFGTTLVACALEGREAWGVELQADRVSLIRERLCAYPTTRHQILHGDARAISAPDSTVDLVLTSLTYFEVPGDGADFESAYQSHLRRLDEAIARQRRAMRSGALFVAAAQNLRMDGHFVPFAWDVARLLGTRLTLRDERLLVYDRERTAAADVTTTNRSHEYILVARRDDSPIDMKEALATLEALSKVGRFVVIGGLAIALVAPEALDRPPPDADVLVPESIASLDPLVECLIGLGFSVRSWGDPVSLPLSQSGIKDRHYLRATRGQLVVDLTFAAPEAFQTAWERAVTVQGVPVAGRAELRRQLEAAGRPRDLARARAIGAP